MLFKDAFEEAPILSVMRIVLLVQMAVILLPCVIYFAVKLHRNWNEFYMEKRGPNLILLTFIVAVWGPLVQHPYYAIVSLVNPHASYHTSDHEWMLYPSVCCRLLEPSLIALRVYLLWFEQKHSDLVTSEGWLALMDPKFGENNWFYQNSTTFGSSQWMMKCLVFPSAFAWTLLWGVTHYYARYEREVSSEDVSLVYRAFTGLWLLFQCGAVVCCWSRYSSFMDNLEIRSELKGILTIMALASVLMFISAFISLRADQWVDQFTMIILMISLCFAQIAVLWFMVIYPQRKWEAMNWDEYSAPISRRHTNLASTSRASTSRAHKISPSGSRNPDFDVSASDTKSWTDHVSTMEGFTSFCNFLHFQFAAENLLYIVEYMAIKKLVQSDELMKEALNDRELPFDVELPEKMQISCIAKEYREKGVLQVALWDLYNKYVNSGVAHLEINVNFSLRNKLSDLFAPYSKDDLSTNMGKEDAISALVLFEEAAESVAHLMNDTFLRFRKTDVYRELLYRKEKRRRADLVNPSMTVVSAGDVATIYGQGKDNMLW